MGDVYLWINSSTPVGEMMVFNMINLAQFERKQTSERVALNFNARAERGLLNGGPAILGYDKDPNNKGTYIVNEDEAIILKRIFKIYLEEGSLSKTRDRLNDLSIKPKGSALRWTVASVRTILRNKAYVGIREINKCNRDSDQKKIKKWKRYRVVKAAWPGILEKEVFDEVQSWLEKAQGLQRERLDGAERRSYLLSGLIKCPSCHRPLMGNSGHGKSGVHRYYSHQKSKTGEKYDCPTISFPADKIEDAVTSHLAQILKDTGYFDKIETKIHGHFQKSLDESVREQNSLKAAITKIDKEVEKTFSMNEVVSKPGVVNLVEERLTRLSVEKKALSERLMEVEDILDTSVHCKAQAQELRDNIGEFNRGWRKATSTQKKRLIGSVIKELIPRKDGLHVYFMVGSDTCLSTGESKKNVKKEVNNLGAEGSAIVVNGSEEWT